MATTSRSIRSAYRTKAVVDWLALEIEVERPTQFQWLQDILADHFDDDSRSYIKALDAGAGGAATRFLIRLNDAHCRDVDTIRAALAALGQRHTLVGPAIIKVLEVSLDFYPKDDQARADLLPLVARLQTCLAAYGTSQRQVGANKRPDFLDSTRKPDPEQTFYVNNQDDPVSWRVYHKIKDRHQDLPLQDHRARVEFTLRGAGLQKYGINSLDDLVERGFVGFGELLHFRQFIPMPELIAEKQPALAKLLQHATRRDRNMIALYPFGLYGYYRDSRTGKPRNGGRPKPRDHSTHTKSDDELNHLVRDRLRDLTRNFHTRLERKS